MKKTLREEQLLAELQQRGKMTITEIADTFDISEPTARRVAASVAQTNQAIRTHGGVRYLPDAEFEYSYTALKNISVDEKQRIGRYAGTLIGDGDIIFLEGGTTVRQLALALADRLRSGDLKELKVFTNSLNNLTTLSPYCKVTVVGGEFRPERRDFAGYISEKTLKHLCFKYCFLGADAIDLNEGLMATDIDTVRFDEFLITRSEKSVILADSTKFERRSFLSYASISDIGMIVTDSKIPEAVKNDFIKSGVPIVCV